MASIIAALSYPLIIIHRRGEPKAGNCTRKRSVKAGATKTFRCLRGVVRDNRGLQAFLAGVTAAVVGVIIVVSLELIPSAIVGLPSIAIVLAAFFAIVLLKIDVAFVTLGAMATGIAYVVIRALV